MHAGAFLYT